MLLAGIGLKAFELCQSLDFETETDKANITKVLDRLERHCVGETNESFERYVFNQRYQEEHEPIETSVSVLRALVRTCNFGAVEESLLRGDL